MKGPLALLSLFLILAAVALTPDTKELDTIAIDASLAESAAYMEAETVLPRYLAYIRCVVDKWLTQTNRMKADQVRLPRIDATDWAELMERDAEERGVELHVLASSLRLSESFGGSDPRQSVPFAGRDRRGAIRITGQISLEVEATRGLATAEAIRDHSVDVCHPVLYFLILRAHEDAQELLGSLGTGRLDAGWADSYRAAIRKIARILAEGVESELVDAEEALSQEYMEKGVVLSFDVSKKESYGRGGRSDHDVVMASINYEILVTAEDPRVDYFYRGMHRGWSSWSKASFAVRALVRIPKGS